MTGISNTLKRLTSDYIFKYILEDFDASATSACHTLLCAIHLLEESFTCWSIDNVSDKDSSAHSN